MQETLNLKKGLKIKKDQEFFFANDIKIFKLKGCENFKFWKCLEVGQMALTGQLFRGSPHCAALEIMILPPMVKPQLSQVKKAIAITLFNVAWEQEDVADKLWMERTPTSYLR